MSSGRSSSAPSSAPFSAFVNIPTAGSDQTGLDRICLVFTAAAAFAGAAIPKEPSSVVERSYLSGLHGCAAAADPALGAALSQTFRP